MSGLMLLPPSKDKCQLCATKHEKHYPHNQQSMYYHMIFKNKYGRYPTWDDAMKHCSNEMKTAWKEELKMKGVG